MFANTRHVSSGPAWQKSGHCYRFSFRPRVSAGALAHSWLLYQVCRQWLPLEPGTATTRMIQSQWARHSCYRDSVLGGQKTTQLWYTVPGQWIHSAIVTSRHSLWWCRTSPEPCYSGKPVKGTREHPSVPGVGTMVWYLHSRSEAHFNNLRVQSSNF